MANTEYNWPKHASQLDGRLRGKRCHRTNWTTRMRQTRAVKLKGGFLLRDDARSTNQDEKKELRSSNWTSKIPPNTIPKDSIGRENTALCNAGSSTWPREYLISPSPSKVSMKRKREERRLEMVGGRPAIYAESGSGRTVRTHPLLGQTALDRLDRLDRPRQAGTTSQ